MTPRGASSRTALVAYFLTPMIVCLAVHWRAPFIWFSQDDFALLALPLVARESGLLYTLFHPIAQGTRDGRLGWGACG